MGRAFNGSTDRLDWPSIANLTGSAWSVSAWIYLHQVTQSSWIFSTRAGTANNFHLAMNIAASAQLQANVMGATLSYRATTATIPLATLTHVAATIESGAITDASKILLYINGVLVTSYSVTANGTTPENTCGTYHIGGRAYDDARNLDGNISELGVWNRVLAADDIAALAKGISPLYFRQGLIFAPTLMGYTAELDPVSGLTATHDGTTQIAGPPIYYPTGPQIYGPPSSGWPAAVFANYYARMRAA